MPGFNGGLGGVLGLVVPASSPDFRVRTEFARFFCWPRREDLVYFLRDFGHTVLEVFQ